MFETSDHDHATDADDAPAALDGDADGWLDAALDREEHDAGARW